MIEKGSLQPGDRLVGKFKGETYHALVQAKNGDGTFVFEALDGPKSGTMFKSLSSLGKVIVGQECNGWRFWSVEDKEPVKSKGGRPKKGDLVDRYQCGAEGCGRIYQTAPAAKRCRCEAATAARLAGGAPDPILVQIDPLAPSTPERAAEPITRETAEVTA